MCVCVISHKHTSNISSHFQTTYVLSLKRIKYIYKKNWVFINSIRNRTLNIFHFLFLTIVNKCWRIELNGTVGQYQLRNKMLNVPLVTTYSLVLLIMKKNMFAKWIFDTNTLTHKHTRIQNYFLCVPYQNLIYVDFNCCLPAKSLLRECEF